MGAEEAPLHGMAEMEAGADALPKASGSRFYQRKSAGVRVQWAGAVVECRVPAPESALPTSYFRRLGLVLLIEEVDWLTVLRAARSL